MLRVAKIDKTHNSHIEIYVWIFLFILSRHLYVCFKKNLMRSHFENVAPYLWGKKKSF